MGETEGRKVYWLVGGCFEVGHQKISGHAMFV